MSYRHRSEIKVGDVARLFDGRRLRLARQLAGLRKNSLAAKIDRTPTAVASYEKGVKRPAPATVAQLSLVLGVSPAFFLPGPIELEFGDAVAHFRSLRSTTQLARDQAVAYGLATVDVAATLERHIEFPESNFPDFGSTDSDTPEDAARLLREHWKTPTGPIGHLIRMAENQGTLIVFSTPAGSSVDAYSFEGFTRPLVVLNPAKRNFFRQRFDLAHELGHLVMHVDAEPGSTHVESQADRFAAEFLLPEDQIKPFLPTSADWRHLQQLKEAWGVSLQALLFRARALGVMREVTYRNAMASLSAKGWRRREPGVMPALEQPSLLPGAVSLLESTGVSEKDIAEESRIPLSLFRQICSRAADSPELPTEEKEKSLPSGVISLFS